MNQVFISYSTRDLAAARQMRTWLRAVGCRSVFLAPHPKDGIRLGSKWRDALKASLRQARAVLLLVSDHWLQSDQCKAEFEAADLLGKPILVALIEKPTDPLPEFLSRLQICDISDQTVEDEDREKLRSALTELGASGKRSVGSGIRKHASAVSMTAALALSVVAIAIVMGIDSIDPVTPPAVSAESDQSIPCDDSNYKAVMRKGDLKVAHHCQRSYLCDLANTSYRKEIEEQYCVLVTAQSIFLGFEQQEIDFQLIQRRGLPLESAVDFNRKAWRTKFKCEIYTAPSAEVLACREMIKPLRTADRE